MPSEAKKYYEYALECTRLAGNAKTRDAREKLKELVRVWMDAAMREDELSGPRVALTSRH